MSEFTLIFQVVAIYEREREKILYCCACAIYDLSSALRTRELEK